MFSRRIALVTGKGGVGRTTVAAAWATAAAKAGKRVLVAEFSRPGEGDSSLGRVLGVGDLDADPRRVSPNLWACQLWAARGHELFLGSVLPSLLGRAALRSKAIRKFLAAVPSFHEMGLFYHLLTLLRGRDQDGTDTYEMIIVDMPATGHTLALTELPDVLLRLVSKGPIARLLREGQAYLNDPEQTAAWIVTLPETLPINEAIELWEGLRQSKMHIGGMILNRVPLDPFSAEERTLLGELLRSSPMIGELSFSRIASCRDARTTLVGSTNLDVREIPDIACEEPELVNAMVADLAPV